MKILKIAALALVLLSAVFVVLAPIGPVPGFFIGGTATETPDQWPDTRDVHEIRLKVPGSLPRVVIIWVIQVDGELYVVGANESGWVSMIGEQATVEMRLKDATYALTASRVDNDWENIMQAYVGKYQDDYPDIIAGFPSIEEARTTTSVFRLTR